MKLKSTLLVVLIAIFSLSFTACNKTSDKYEYNEKEGYIILSDGKKYKSIEEDWHLNSFSQVMDTCVLNKNEYKILSNSGDNIRYLQLVKTNGERSKLFVRSDLKLPTLKEITDYNVLYKDRGYNYKVLDYYDDSANLDTLPSDYKTIFIVLKVKKYDGINLSLPLYYVGENLYIQNINNKYVKLPSNYFFESDIK